MRRIWTCMIALILALCILPGTARAAEVVAEGTCGAEGDNLTWVLTDDGVLTISGEGAMADYAAASESPWYSQRESIQKIVIENEVTTIGDRAIYNCTALADVAIGESVGTVGTYAFRGCTALTEISLPASVTELKDSAFRTCSALAAVTFGGNAPVIGNYVFQECAASLTVQYYEGSTGFDAAPWTDYAQEAFHVGEWVIDAEPTCTDPGSRHIDCAYCGTTITETLPAGHIYVEGVCSRCGEVLILGSGACGDGLTWELDGLGKLTICGNGNMWDFSYNSTLCWRSYLDRIGSVQIEEGVTSIGSYAFRGCSSLTSITIPEGVTSIGEDAFYGCSSLTSITIPEGMTSIADGTFFGCDSLTSITIPESVTSIGSSAFSYCSSLTDVYISDVAAWLGISFDSNSIFANPLRANYLDKKLYLNGELVTDLVIPESVTSIGEYAFYYCSSLTSITIPESVTSIGLSAFNCCRSLTSITIPESVTSIADRTFLGCRSLTSITIPESVTSIGSHAFYNCSSLTSVVIPESVTSIGEYAFYGCSSLTSITIPEGVTSIADWTFNGCDSLTSITIPESVTSIGKYAFDGCSSLTDVYFGGSEETWRDLLNRPSASRQHFSSTDPDSHWAAVTVDATCTENGYTAESCGCGYERNRMIIASLGHDYAAAVTNPTCTDAGFTTHTCTRCGDSYTDTPVTALGHSFGAWETTVAATCTEDGEQRRECERCDHYETEVVTRLGHDFGVWETTKEATCTEDGEQRRDCERCDHYETEVLAKLGHDYQTAVTAPTCTEQGYTTYTCRCGESYVADYTDALGHTYRDGVCAVCGTEDPAWRPPLPGVIRIAGDDRIATSLMLADQLKEVLGVEKFDAVVVASALNFPDALTGSYLAAVKKAPILLTYDAAHAKVTEYIVNNLKPGGSVYVLGGESAVSAGFMNGLAAKGILANRVAGSDRFGTNLAIMKEAGVSASQPILIATALNFADSLSASAAGLPMVLVYGSLRADQKEFLETTSKNFIIIGGTSAVSESLEAELKTIGTVERLAGAGRYQTSVMVAQKFVRNPDDVVLAYARNFPDGLCGGPLAYALGAPLILTDNYDPSEADKYVDGITAGIVVGGTGLISDETVTAIFDK